MKRMFFMLMVLPSFAISAQESNFEFKNPTKILFGKGQIEKIFIIKKLLLYLNYNFHT